MSQKDLECEVARALAIAAAGDDPAYVELVQAIVGWRSVSTEMRAGLIGLVYGLALRLEDFDDE